MDLTYNVHHPASYEDYFLKKLVKKIGKPFSKAVVSTTKKLADKKIGKETADKIFSTEVKPGVSLKQAGSDMGSRVLGTGLLVSALGGIGAAAAPLIGGAGAAGAAGSAGAAGAGAAKGGLAALGAKVGSIGSAAKLGLSALKKGDLQGTGNAIKSITGDKAISDLTKSINDSNLIRNLQEIRNVIPEDIIKEVESGMKKNLSSQAKKLAATIEAGRTNSGLLPKTRPLKRGEEAIINTATKPTVVTSEIPTYVYFIAGFVGLIILFMVIKMLK